jgi:hypothetical protein
MHITDGLPDDGADSLATAANRRLYVRYVADAATVDQPVASWTTERFKWQAHIRHVSRSGIGLVLPRRFERGTRLAIDVPGGNGASPHTVFARIIRVLEEPDACWFVGCTFVSELSDEELQALVYAIPEDDDELPRRPRTEAAGAVTWLRATVPTTGHKRRTATVVEDVCLHMLLGGGRWVRRRVRRLHVPGSWPLRPGSTVRARRRTGIPRGRPLTMFVRACERDARGWVVTCDVVGVSIAAARRWLNLRD